MSWRTVLITHKAKASYKDGYMIVKSDESENIIHLSEIATVIFENTAINITAYLLCELANNKVKIIFVTISVIHMVKLFHIMVDIMLVKR